MNINIALWTSCCTLGSKLAHGFRIRPDAALFTPSTTEDTSAAIEDDLFAPIEQPIRCLYLNTQTLPNTLDLSWALTSRHVFLIRDPLEIESECRANGTWCEAENTGHERLFRFFCRLQQDTGELPLVVEQNDLLRALHPMLATLCRHLDVPFLDCMLDAFDGRETPHPIELVDGLTDATLRQVTYYERLCALRLDPLPLTNAGALTTP